MNRFFCAALFALIATSCKEISFEHPQPEGRKSLTSIPKALQGKYLTLTDEGRPSKDTIVITPHGYRFGYYDVAERSGKNDQYEQGVLSDTLVLKSYKGYYFLNLNEKPEWLLRVLKPERNGDLIYMALEDKNAEFEDFMQKLSVEIRIDSMDTGTETLYQIHPSANKLIDLIDKGYFSKTRLVKIK